VNKTAPIPGTFPPTDERPRPLSHEEINRAKLAEDDAARLAIYRELLEEGRRRLAAGRKLEVETGVIFSEQTCICRDVERWARLVYAGSPAVKGEAGEVDPTDAERSEGLRWGRKQKRR
jgi:hypothetical protein